jgi:hypothetical protein
MIVMICRFSARFVAGFQSNLTALPCASLLPFRESVRSRLGQAEPANSKGRHDVHWWAPGPLASICGKNSMSTTISSLRLLTSDLSASLARVGKEPSVKRATDTYLSEIEKVKSIDDFMSNDKVYNYAMKAFGLEDMAYAKAFIRRVLTEGIDDSGSMANRLTDTRFRDLAETFNFARYGSTATVFTRTKDGVVDRYLNQTLEVEVGEGSEGVRLALYFNRKAATVTNAYSLMGDRALLKVTQVALGLSASTSMLDIERQKNMIDKKLDVSDLKDPEKLEKFLTRFAVLWDMENPQMQGSSSPVLNLFNNTSSAAMSVDLLQQMQNFGKRG